MNQLVYIKCSPLDNLTCSKELSRALNKGKWVQLFVHDENKITLQDSQLPIGPGVIISSGGSANGPHQCLLPSMHLDQSALATEIWLKDQGISSRNCIIFNPLPINHISGLMPWWRSKRWGSQHIWISPQTMKDPSQLELSTKDLLGKNKQKLLISIVPTQLQRLSENPKGILWLKNFDVIWVGGARLSNDLEFFARKQNLRLAPCYGATETAAMVTILNPKDFLAGKSGCGNPLKDVKIDLNNNGTLKIKTSRLAISKIKNNALESLIDDKGWWSSGDIGKLDLNNSKLELKIIGRADNAINSGGTTIFPDKIEMKLMKIFTNENIPIDKILILPRKDEEWGERVVAILRFKSNKYSFAELQKKIKFLIDDWPPEDKPISWHECPELEENSTGKWERKKWIKWLDSQI